MVSKTKRALALVLTAMMAASALAGCGPNNGGGTQNSAGGENSAASAGGEDSTASGTGSTASQAEVKDINDPGVKQTIISAMEGEAADNGGEISLVLWCSGDDKPFEKTLVEAFKEEYASDKYEIKVKIVNAYGEDKAGSKVLENPQEAGDVFNMADDQLSQLVTANAIAEVGALFQGNVVANNTEDAVKVCSVNGKSYAFPKTSDNGYFLYYDKRVFKDDEVDNFDEMIKKANENGKSVYYNITGPWYMTGFFFTAGCDITYDVTTDKQVATFNTDQGLSAGKAICHLAESQGKGFEGSPGTVGDNAFVQQGFQEGTLAAAVIGTWMGPVIKEAIGEENVGAAKLPTVLMDGEQKQLDSFGGYKIVGVNAYTKYPISSQVLAYYLTSEDSQIKRYQERGLIPTNTKALEDDKIKNDPALKAIEAQMPYAHPQGVCVGGTYWAVKPETIGSEAYDKKGKLTDDRIKEILQNIVTQLEGE